MERIAVTVARTCDAYREKGFHRTEHPVPAERFDQLHFLPLYEP
ncbi:hypothetical protein [Streptomyces sp. SM11]|nr:hypothetical protein [Streptomyces sp. SM11]